MCVCNFHLISTKGTCLSRTSPLGPFPLGVMQTARSSFNYLDKDRMGQQEGGTRTPDNYRS